MKTKLKKIADKYGSLEYNSKNFHIGGGLDGEKFASRRHEDAKDDKGKLTLGQAVQLFKKATALETEQVKEVLLYAVPNMEWHHAGKLPKAYGGGMKKTYFLNSVEICEVANNWEQYVDRLNISKEAERAQLERINNRDKVKSEFLNKHAKKVFRTDVKPELFYETGREMNGKYGWFDSTYKSYNMPEYFTGWIFKDENKLKEFYQL